MRCFGAWRPRVSCRPIPDGLALSKRTQKQIEGKNVSKVNSIPAVALIVASLSGNAAFAHPVLQSTDPAAGSAATISPKQIRITFNEAVIPQFSGVELKDQAGKPVATGKAAVDPVN